jgi:hypothetical protein
MIADIIRTQQFKHVFSILLGVGIVIVLFRPYCKGGDCAVWKAPPPTEIDKAVYKVGEKCYQFSQADKDCRVGEKYIEAFRGEFSCRRGRGS